MTEDLEQELISLSKASRLESYSSKRCKKICESHNVYVNEFDLLTVRRNSLIFIPSQSQSQRQIRRPVKLAGDASDPVKLSSCQENESYKLTQKI